MRWIAHVDMDSFYVSVERLKNTLLRDRPMVVGGRGPRSVVSSASYEAREFGVRSAMPVSQARRLCPDLLVVEPHMDWYREISEEIFEGLKKIAPKVEQVSVDEAYLDFTGCDRLYASREESALKIKETVGELSGLTCTVCVSTNKLISKIGSDLAKPNGLLVVKPGTEEQLLAPLSIRKIPGIGTKTAPAFERKGIKVCADLVKTSDDLLLRNFGKYALEFKEMAQGLDDTEVISDWDRKSLGTEETFDKDLKDERMLVAYMRDMCEEVASDLRSEDLKARTIQIKFRYADFSTFTRARTLLEPTADSKTIAETAIDLLLKSWNPEVPLRLLGVGAHNLLSKEECPPEQMDFFKDPAQEAKREKIEALKDELKRRFGRDALVRPK